MRGREKSSNFPVQLCWLSLWWGDRCNREVCHQGTKSLAEMAVAAGRIGSNVSVGTILAEVL